MGTPTETDPVNSASRTCLACARPLGPESFEGLCPTCLLGRALELSSTADEPDEPDWMSLGSGMAGVVLGDYQLESLVAQGGMGAVYRARHRKLNRQVAVKVVQAGDFATPALVERLRIEALAVSSLNHPHVIKIFESGIDQGWHFFAMEWVAGSSLRARLREVPLSFRDAAGLMVKVARAVDHSHQRGVLHRDLKPANILIDEHGEPRLTDFGLAKMLEHESGLTLTQAVIGTPAYMSPEQAGGASRDITTATDVYGLGAILYELLSGSPPFSAANTPALLRAIVEQEPLPLRRRQWPEGVVGSDSAIPSDLAVVCLKCLEKSPSRRYRTAGEVADELERWLRHEPIQARPVSVLESAWKWMRRHPLAAALSLALSAGIIGIAGVSNAYGRKIAAVAEEQRQELVRLQLENGDRYSIQNDPAKALVHFASAWKADAGHPERDVFYQRRLGSALRHLPELQQVWSHQKRVNSVEWSPDGQWVLTSSDDGTARLWPAGSEGISPVVFQHDGRVTHARFSPDGRSIATLCTNSSGRVWDRTTGQPTGPGFGMSRPRFMHPSVPPFDFSPDSRTILSISNRDVSVRDVATGELRGPRLQHTNSLNQASYGPDGRRALIVTRKGVATLWNPAEHQLTGPQIRLEHPFDDGHSSGVFSPGGASVFLFSLRGDARLIDAITGKSIAAFTRHPRLGHVMQAGFFSSGERLFTLRGDGALNFWSIPQGEWIETIPPLSSEDVRSGLMAAISPDGARAAVSAGSGAVSLHELSSGTGSGVVLRHSDLVHSTRFSPDGRRLAVGSGNGLVQVWGSYGRSQLLGVKHSSPVQTSGYLDSGQRFFTAGQDGALRFWDATSGQQVGEPWVHPSAIVQVRFDPGRRHVAVGCVDGSVHVRELDSGRLRFPPLLHQRMIAWLEFSPDGQTLLTVAGNPAHFTGDLRLWDAVSGDPRCDSKSIPSMSKGGGFFPDGSLLFTWSNDGLVRFWDPRTGLLKEELTRSSQWVPEAALSRDGKRLLLALSSSDGAPHPALVIDVASRRELLRLNGHRSGVVRVMWSPGETRILTVSNDGSARNWDSSSGHQVGRPMIHRASILCVSYSHDGRWVATGSYDRTARVWEAETGLPVTPPLPHGGEVSNVSFTPDGNRLLTSGEDGSARVWDISPTRAGLEDVARMALLYSGHRLDENGDWIPVPAREVEELWGRLKVLMLPK